ncbi:hypothetical protein C1J03_19505 [Sulfitobacter sp. SK012]|uniref:hypothetical protein n=1 Tax=Sulfitobacter sp. SK012 TaxID=1389005 RepID=UPI000E0A3023|nr:hypothetical protein [Sulfitobacter sp. SK012]AXI47994.1 hypothetical protein C1J03_19505 [Sulfitobacter sp. SK012]
MPSLNKTAPLRVAVIGNSHVGALRLGQKRLPERHADVEITYHSMPGGLARQLVLGSNLQLGLPEDVVLNDVQAAALKRLGSQAPLDLSTFDHVLFVGLSNTAMVIAQFLASHRIEGLYEAGPGSLVSREVAEAVLEALAFQVVPQADWVKWQGRSLTQYIGPRAAMTVDDPNADERRFGAWRTLAQSEVSPGPALDAFEDKVAATLAERGFFLMRQPRETLGSNSLTKPEYLNFFGREMPPGGDYVHMNAAYGASFLTQYFDGLKDGNQKGLT